MTKEEKFKIGFLRKVAEMGLRPSDFEHAMHKVAVLGDIFKAAPGLAAAGLVGLPLAGGALLGAGVRGAGQSDDPDLDEVKKEELINLYRRLARDHKLKMQARQGM